LVIINGGTAAFKLSRRNRPIRAAGAVDARAIPALKQAS
jgi:hypothetical protein